MERNFLDFITQHVTQVADLHRAANEALWEHSLDGSPEAEERLAAARRELEAVYADRELYARVRTYDEEHMSEQALTRRQLHLMRLEFARHQLPADAADRLKEEEANARRIVRTFRARIDGKRASDEEVAAFLRTSADAERRREVWQAARGLGDEVGPTLLRIVGIRNRAARDLGYRDYYHMALELQEVDEDALVEIVDELVEATEAPYVEAKAALDDELSERFGCRPSELEPWHYSDPFFKDAPPHRDLNVDRFFAGQDLARLATDFFDGMGLDVRDILERSDTEAREGKEQTPFCLHVDPRGDDVRVMLVLRDTHAGMAALLRHLGQAVYRKYLSSELPYVLRGSSHDSLCSEAIGLLFAQCASSPRFLVEHVGANKSVVTRTTNELRRQTRLATLIMARWVPVMVYFERALYEDPGRNLNRLWWELVERLQGLGAPENGPAHAWAGKMHLLHSPVYYHNYLLGQLMASQIKAALVRDAGVKDIVGEPDAGRWLRERLFAHGSQFHWNEAIERASGEPLSAKWFLEEFISG